ncbi:MAG: cell division protein SepF [Acidimicrobiales bacterium]
MASMWKKAMLYLGLGPDEEYDDYVPEEAPPREPERPPPAPYQPPPAPYPPPAGAAAEQPAPAPYGSVRTIAPQPLEAVGDRVGPASGIGSISPVRSRAGVVRPMPATVNAKPQVVTPVSFNDAQELADNFKSNTPVIMNLQPADRDLARRLIDFASGLCYGLGGAMEKVAHQVYLLTPSNVEVSAEERRRLERGQYS